MLLTNRKSQRTNEQNEQFAAIVSGKIGATYITEQRDTYMLTDRQTKTE